MGHRLRHRSAIPRDRASVYDKNNRFCIVQMFSELVSDSRMTRNIDNTYCLLALRKRKCR